MKSNGLKPDLPSPWPKAKYSPTGLDNIGQWQEPFPEDLKEELPMQLPSLPLLPHTWLNSLQTGSNPASRGEGRIPARHTHPPSHMLSFCDSLILISPNPAQLQSECFVLLGGELRVKQNHGLFGSMKKIMAAGSVCGACLCHWSLAFREQLLCSHKNTKKERKDIKYLQEEK